MVCSCWKTCSQTSSSHDTTHGDVIDAKECVKLKSQSHYRLRIHSNLYLDDEDPSHFEDRSINDGKPLTAWGECKVPIRLHHQCLRNHRTWSLDKNLLNKKNKSEYRNLFGLNGDSDHGRQTQQHPHIPNSSSRPPRRQSRPMHHHQNHNQSVSTRPCNGNHPHLNNPPPHNIIIFSTLLVCPQHY